MKFSCIKIVNTFLNHMDYLVEILMLKFLTSLKTEVDKLDIDKLVPLSVDLSKLSDVVKKMLLKMLSMINQLKK